MTASPIGFVSPQQYAEDYDDALGREFLTWLWFKNELPESSFIIDGTNKVASIDVSDRITVTGGDVDSRYKATETGKSEVIFRKHGMVYCTESLSLTC